MLTRASKLSGVNAPHQFEDILGLSGKLLSLATRYDRPAANYLVSIQLASIRLWLAPGNACDLRWQASKSVRAPALAADAVMHEKQSVRIVAPLDVKEPLIVRTPQRVLPVRLEIVALVDVRAGVRRRTTQRLHRGVHAVPMRLRENRIGRSKTTEGGRAGGCDDRKGEGIECVRMGRRVPCFCDHFR